MLENEGDREAQQRIEKARRERARTLDLSDMKLKELLTDVTVLKTTADMELDITEVAYDSRKSHGASHLCRPDARRQ